MGGFDTCIDCKTKLKTSFVMFKGTILEALVCPKCEQKIFTEKQRLKVIKALVGIWSDIKETGQKYQDRVRKEWKKRIS